MGVHTRASNAHSNVSSRNASHSVDENSLASAAAGAASRPARLKSTALSNKAPNAGGAANIKAENAPRSALSSVSLSNTNAQAATSGYLSPLHHSPASLAKRSCSAFFGSRAACTASASLYESTTPCAYM
ncbi:hypothetical protein GQ54DRAFT_301535 [Martensiomyces pterosporus]|nr:hypothetical protein GQ54DRAFT_301535 [Martensiomyces pterosporus]